MPLVILGVAGLLFFLIQNELAQPYVYTDSNVYLYIADQLTRGKVLYKDLFFTNLPLWPHIAALYETLSFGSIPAFYRTAALEAVAASVLVYLIVQKRDGNRAAGLLAALLHLASYAVFASSSHQNGILTGILLFYAGYFALLYRRYMLAGAFLAVMVGVKAYLVPLALAVLLAEVFVERAGADRKGTRNKSPVPPLRVRLIRLAAGGVAVTLAFLTPVLLTAGPRFLEQTFGYSLSRAAGFDKIGILWAFVKTDPLVCVLLAIAVVRFRQDPFPALATVCGILFALLHKDLYLFYLNMLVPPAVLVLPAVYHRISSLLAPWRFAAPVAAGVLAVGILAIQGPIAASFISGLRGFMTIPNLEETVAWVREQRPAYLYGESGIVQGIAYRTGIPLLDGIADPNRNLFRSGKLDRAGIARRVLESDTLLIVYAKGDDLTLGLPPEYHILDWNLLQGECTVLRSQEFRAAGPDRLAFVRCGL